MAEPTSYLPQVAWETIASDIVKLSSNTYRVTVKPEAINDVGAGEVEVGFYLMDFLGDTFTVTGLNVGGISGNIEVTDSFMIGKGPVTDRTAIVYKSVGDGEAPFLAPVMQQRLDKSAFDKIRAWELDILWKDRITIHPDSEDILSIDGDRKLKFIDNSIIVRIDFQTLDEFVYTCPTAIKFITQTSENTNATLSVGLNTDMAQYDDVTITPTSLGLIILEGVQL